MTEPTMEDLILQGNRGESRVAPNEDAILLEDGDLVVNGMLRVDTSKWEGKVTTGDYGLDSDQLMSSWIQSNWSGGGLNDTHELGGTDQRFRWGNAWTLNARQLALPPKQTVVTLNTSGAGSILNTLPVGYFNGAVWVSIGDTRLRPLTWSGTAYVAGLHVGMGAANNTGVVFNNKLWWPYSGFPGGLANIDAALTLTTSAAFAPVALCTWDKRIYALTSDGYLRYAPVSEVWVAADPDLKLPVDQIPIDLCTFYNRAGKTTVFILTDKQVWEYDSSSDTIFPWSDDFPVTANSQFSPWAGESLYISADVGVTGSTRDGVKSPMGMDRDDGLPTDRLNFRIDAMTKSLNFLIAAASYGVFPANPTPGMIAVWNQQGWHEIATIPPTSTGSFSPKILMTHDAGGYNLWVGGWRSDQSIATTGTTTNITYIPLPYNFHGPKQNILTTIGRFQPSATHWTGWFDGGMEGFDKLLSHFEIELVKPEGIAYDNDVYVNVYYRINRDPTTLTYLGRTTMYGHNILPFGIDADGFARGVSVNTVEFRYDLFTDDPTKSPIICHTNLKYIKLPQAGASWTADVPLDQPNALGLGPREVSQWLSDLTIAPRFLKMTHRGVTYRVRIAQHASAESLGYVPYSRDSISILRVPIENWDGVS